MSNLFLTPNIIYTGKGAIYELKNIIKHYGKKALIVTDPFMVKSGKIEELKEIINSAGIDSIIFSDITGEPVDLMINKGTKIYIEESCDFIIALGGGSVLDSMKAIAIMAISKVENINEFMGKEINLDLPKMIAIPTTSGTGSEATQFTIITDTKNDVKMLLKGQCLIPNVAIIDPKFTISAPMSVTIGPGVDALCHAIEAYTSRKAQKLSDTFALSAISRIFKNLPLLFDNLENEEARNEMSLASLEAGIAFNNSSVTLVHGMSRPIGALFHVPHGISNAMLLYACMEFVVDGSYERFADISRYLKLTDSNDNRIAADIFIFKLKELLDYINIPTLEEYGIDKNSFFDNISKMANDALESGSPSNTLKSINKEDIEKLYKKLW